MHGEIKWVRKDFCEVFTFDIFHNHKVQVIFISGIVSCDDVRMLKSGDNTGLFEKAFDDFRSAFSKTFMK